MSTAELTRCDNLACLCEIPLAETSCSDYCRSADGRDASQIICKCGHGACMEAVKTQLAGGAGSENAPG